MDTRETGMVFNGNNSKQQQLLNQKNEMLRTCDTGDSARAHTLPVPFFSQDAALLSRSCSRFTLKKRSVQKENVVCEACPDGCARKYVALLKSVSHLYKQTEEEECKNTAR